MAIVVDPDVLDRDQVVFNVVSQLISLFPVGTIDGAETSDGVTTAVARQFTSAGYTFDSGDVGKILAIKSKTDAGHYTIATFSDANTVLVTATADFTDWIANETAITFSVLEDGSDASGDGSGASADGATEQALYSFSKEEWKTDAENYDSDDLIRHHFPLEAITREQMEVGGGAQHDGWSWFDEQTRKKIRTGGWADKNAASTTLQEWTGIITLGSVDTDAQVYYQQVSVTTDPTDFDFLGPVNEPIKIFTDGGADNRTFLKLFVRKKARTYVGAQISDIGVSTIETIVNRFPLAHTSDPAIAADDADIIGGTAETFRAITNRGGAADGISYTDTQVFESATADFVGTAAGVVPGDTLILTDGADADTYTISEVINATGLIIKEDFEITGGFTFAGSTSTTYTTNSNIRFAVRTTGFLATGVSLSDVGGSMHSGVFTNASSDECTFVDAISGDFVTAGVVAGDLLVVQNATGVKDVEDIYKILSRDSATQLTINTIDQLTTGVNDTVSYYVREKGMFLSRREDIPTNGDLLVTADFGTLTFADANPDTIARSAGSWIDDGYDVTGMAVTVTDAPTSTNNGIHTVASATATTLTLVSTDTLTAEASTAPSVTGLIGFHRAVGSEQFGFKWKLYGNDTTLANCYEFLQHQLRQSGDVDFGPAVGRGDITDLLMSYTAPNATTTNLYIDDLIATDVNSITLGDQGATSRTNPFAAAGTMTFNNNLTGDASAIYHLFFTRTGSVDDTVTDYGTTGAITVKNNASADISGFVGATASIAFTYDYDANVQRGAASAGTDAEITLVAIGLTGAQFVLAEGTIERSTTNTIGVVAALERNYLNT